MKRNRDNIPDFVLSKLKNGQVTDEQEQKFAEWHIQEEHRLLYAEIAEMWEVAQARTSGYTPDMEQGWIQLQQRLAMSRGVNRKKHIVSRRIGMIAAAAAVVIAVITGLSIQFESTDALDSQVEQPKDPVSLITQTGRSTVVLPDGTKVWVQAGSSIVYKSNYPTAGRYVRVKGEAFFDVAPDLHNPFIVEAEGIEVKVHGTRFNIEAFPNSTNIKVVLVEGLVSLQYDQKEAYLKPGQEGVVDRTDRSLTVSPTDTLMASIASLDRIRLEHLNMGQVCRYLSKRYHKRIDVDAHITEKYAFTFTLRNETLEEILQMMSRINPITYEFLSSDEVIIRELTQ